MKNNGNVTITVYGAEEVCASCVGAPNSKETYSWLQAAIGRKYSDGEVQYEYIDMNNPPEDEKHKKFVEQMVEEDLFYPLVLVNDDIVGEGFIRLKPIYKALDENGVTLKA